jgi:putative transposase
LYPAGVRENREKERWYADEEIQTRTDHDAAATGGSGDRQWQADAAKACREAGISEQTFYRWRKEYCGLKLDQAKRLKALEQENAKLKRLVAELSLEKQILQDVAAGNL